MTNEQYWEKRCLLAEKLLDFFMEDETSYSLEQGLATADLLVYGEHQHLIANEKRKELL